MSVVTIKLTDDANGEVGVLITATNVKDDSNAIIMASLIKSFIDDMGFKEEKNGCAKDVHKQDHPLLPKKELILPDSLTH